MTQQPNYRRLSEEQVSEIIALRERGRGLDYIAERFGVSPGAINYQCLKNGALSPRQRFRAAPENSEVVMRRNGTTQRVFTAEEDQRLLALEAEGISYAEISRRMNRPRTSVRMRLLRLAIAEELQ